MSLFLRTSIIKRYSRRGRRPRRPPACSWLSFFCDAAHHRVVGDADPYDPKIKKRRTPSSGPTPRTISPQPMHQLQFGSGPCPEKMTLGDSVNIVKGHFHSVLVSNIFGYLAFCWIRPLRFTQWLLQNLYFLGGFLGSVLALIVLGACCLPVHWYHLFVPKS